MRPLLYVIVGILSAGPAVRTSRLPGIEANVYLFYYHSRYIVRCLKSIKMSRSITISQHPWPKDLPYLSQRPLESLTKLTKFGISTCGCSHDHPAQGHPTPSLDCLTRIFCGQQKSEARTFVLVDTYSSTNTFCTLKIFDSASYFHPL